MYNDIQLWWILNTWIDKAQGTQTVWHANGYLFKWYPMMASNEPLRNTILLQVKRHLGTEYSNLLKLMSNRWPLNAQTSC